MKNNPNLRLIELTKLIEKYARKTQERRLNQLNNKTYLYINLHQPSLYSNWILNHVYTPSIQNNK